MSYPHKVSDDVPQRSSASRPSWTSRTSRVLTDSSQLLLTVPIVPSTVGCVDYDTILNANDVIRLTGRPVGCRYRLLGCRPLPDVALGAVSVRVEVTVRVRRVYAICKIPRPRMV